jgi:hypothetical protein
MKSTENLDLKRQFINSMCNCPDDEPEKVLAEIVDYIVY